MEIKYIWVRKFQVLENMDLNFKHKGKHRFSFADNELSLLENLPPVLDFGPKVSGITTIVGPNGSGKTTVCDLLLNAAATLSEGSMAIYKNFDGILCFGEYIFVQEKLNIKNEAELLSHGYKLVRFESSPLEDMDWDDVREISKTGFVYLSTMFDGRYFEQINLANYSTIARLYNDHISSTSVKKSDYHFSQDPDYIGDYYDEQNFRNVKYYLNFSDRMPVPKPMGFYLRAIQTTSNRATNYRNDRFKYEQYKEFGSLESTILYRVYPHYSFPETGSKITVDQNELRIAVKELYRYNLLLACYIDRGSLPTLEELTFFVLSRQIPPFVEDKRRVIIELLDLHEWLVDNGTFEDNFTYQGNGDFRFDAMKWLEIPSTEQNILALRLLIDFESELINQEAFYAKRISNYNFASYNSSGEYNYLVIFSRLYEHIQKNVNGRDDRENFILLLDEVDLGFHPIWKKKLLSWVIDFLNSEFNSYEFQIVFATHSPYLLSDLTEDHLIVLNNLEGKTKVMDNYGRQTFGANIHDLLADNFFMSKGMIGDFAKQNIQWVIDRLTVWRKQKLDRQHLEISREEQERCLRIINVIGDDIVRKKLWEMYMEIFSDESELQREIDLLTQRLNELNNKKR